ncbi:ribonuclease H-like domain-containing protein, partial [Tanacetum coccineum]
LSWSAKRQPTLSQSSAEAEYRGVANAVAETCWLRNLLRELHTPLSSATLVYCDNVSAVYLSCNLVQHQRTKHIEIDIHFVHDLVAAGQCHMLILLLMGSYVVKDGNESTPGDMIRYREIVSWLTLAVQTTDEVGSSSGSKLVASDSPAFEALRRTYVNEIPYAIRGRGMNNLLANRLKVDTNVGRLAVRLGWSLSNHYWCRYPEYKSYGKTSRESRMVSDLVEGVGKELL